MLLNPNNNFFLEFIEYKNKLQIKKTIFLPHIKNIRNKFEDNKIKIRVENITANIYIVSKKPGTLKYLSMIFSDLIN